LIAVQKDKTALQFCCQEAQVSLAELGLTGVDELRFSQLFLQEVINLDDR